LAQRAPLYENVARQAANDFELTAQRLAMLSYAQAYSLEMGVDVRWLRAELNKTLAMGLNTAKQIDRYRFFADSVRGMGAVAEKLPLVGFTLDSGEAVQYAWQGKTREAYEAEGAAIGGAIGGGLPELVGGGLVPYTAGASLPISISLSVFGSAVLGAVGKQFGGYVFDKIQTLDSLKNNIETFTTDIEESLKNKF
jgi:hypothetical protein